MTKTSKKPVRLPVLPEEHKYLRGLITDAVWLITSKIEDEEQATSESVIPREILLRISLAHHKDVLPILVSESISFGKPYGKVESEYISNLWEMGMPSWYDTYPDEEDPRIEAEKIWSSEDK